MRPMSSASPVVYVLASVGTLLALYACAGASHVRPVPETTTCLASEVRGECADTELTDMPILIRVPIRVPPGTPRSGWVLFEAVVGTDGRVEPETIRLLDYSHPQLVDVGQEAMLGVEYRPGRLNGVPVRVLVRQPIIFDRR